VIAIPGAPHTCAVTNSDFVKTTRNYNFNTHTTEYVWLLYKQRTQVIGVISRVLLNDLYQVNSIEFTATPPRKPNETPVFIIWSFFILFQNISRRLSLLGVTFRMSFYFRTFNNLSHSLVSQGCHLFQNIRWPLSQFGVTRMSFISEHSTTSLTVWCHTMSFYLRIFDDFSPCCVSQVCHFISEHSTTSLAVWCHKDVVFLIYYWHKCYVQLISCAGNQMEVSTLE